MEQSCAVCLTAPPTVTLHPCAHALLCAACAVRLPQPLCPACRRPVSTARFDSVARPVRDFPAVLAARKARDEADRAAVAQVLVLAAPDAQKLAASLIQTWTHLFQPSERVEGGWARAAARGELEGLPYHSRFEANAVVKGTPVRFTLLCFPANEAARVDLIFELRASQPDFLLLAASLHLRRSMATLLSWDSLLRHVFGQALPRRMWIFLTAPLLTVATSGVADNLYFKEDVAAALNSMPELDRPLTYHVLEPKGWRKRTAKKVAQRSAFHACLRRPLTP